MNALINKHIIAKHLGNIDYQQAWDFQAQVFDTIVQHKIANRTLPVEQQTITSNYIFLCEHPHVYTLGKSGKEENLLQTPAVLASEGISFVHINRGGDITYHGPGQLVAYPVMDMDNFFTDIHRYMRLLEESVIQTLAHFDLHAGRIAGLTGVWMDFVEQKNPRKIAAFGVKMSRWVTMHGLALNVNTDLKYFNNIIPCGITDKAVTSMQQELGKTINMEEVEQIFLQKFEKIFEAQIET